MGTHPIFESDFDCLTDSEMSQYLSLCKVDIVDQIYRLQNLADLERHREFEAAIRIQSWVRGNQLRKYIAFLHGSARRIQACYRGYRGRRKFQQVVNNAVNTMRDGYYTEMATKIQARWRGYYTRKYKHNFYARKNYLQGVFRRNIEVREALSEFVETQEEEKSRENRRFEEQEKMLQARRLHYMRSTYQINGVFASPWFPQNDFERLLSSVKPLSKEEREKLFPRLKANDKSQIDRSLPPIKNPPLARRIAGPFRDPNEVHNQRYRALSPTLRVATAFDSAEQQARIDRDMEWTRRIQDRPMNFPARRTIHKSYEPLLHTTSKYGDIPYGTKFFREESEEVKSAKNSFKSVVPPIPIFDKVGKTFGKGTVY